MLVLFIVHVGTPALGSFEGHFFTPSVSRRKTSQRLQIHVESYCIGQAVPVFEDRFFRTGIDNHLYFIHTLLYLAIMVYSYNKYYLVP